MVRMKAFLLPLIILCCASLLHALPHEKDKGTNYVFGDKVNLREEPSGSAAVKMVLAAGTAIRVTEKTDETFEYRGLIDYWYKVELEGGAAGYIWGGMLTNNFTFCDIDGDAKDELILVRNFSWGIYSRETDDLGNTVFSKTGYDRNNPGDKIQIRVIKNGRLLFESGEFRGYGETGISSMAMIRVSGFGSGDLAFLRIVYTGRGELNCSGETWLYYRPGRLIRSFDIFHGGDGGDYTSYRLILPADKEGAPAILRAVVTMTLHGFDPSAEKVEVTDYVWDSGESRFVKKPGEK